MSNLAVPSALVLLSCLGLQAVAQPPATVTREATVSATVESVEKSSRVVTFRREGNILQSIYVDPSVKELDELRPGDVVTVRFVESVIVKVRPEAQLTDVRETTDEARQAGNKDVVLQEQVVVTIESINPDGLFVTYRTRDNLLATRAVNDKRLLEGLHAGDRVEVTLTRERAISIERGRR